SGRAIRGKKAPGAQRGIPRRAAPQGRQVPGKGAGGHLPGVRPDQRDPTGPLRPRQETRQVGLFSASEASKKGAAGTLAAPFNDCLSTTARIFRFLKKF